MKESDGRGRLKFVKEIRKKVLRRIWYGEFSLCRSLLLAPPHENYFRLSCRRVDHDSETPSRFGLWERGLGIMLEIATRKLTNLALVLGYLGLHFSSGAGTEERIDVNAKFFLKWK